MWFLFLNSLGNSYFLIVLVKVIVCVIVIEYVMEMFLIKYLDFINVMFIL